LELANQLDYLLIVITFIAERSISRIAIPRNVSQTGNPKSAAAEENRSRYANDEVPNSPQALSENATDVVA